MNIAILLFIINVIYIQKFIKYKFIFFVLSVVVILKKASTTQKCICQMLRFLKLVFTKNAAKNTLVLITKT